MQIYTKAGSLAFYQFTFPDGQRHFKLETHERDHNEVTIETALTSAQDLFDVLLATDVLHNYGYTVNLDVRYMLGARMDRSIDCDQPFTLRTIARVLNSQWYNKVRVLDAHSDRTIKLLYHAYNVLPYGAVKQVYEELGRPLIVIPDAGAEERVNHFNRAIQFADAPVQCRKHRDMATGALSGFSIEDPSRVEGRTCLILDDICDGGGTFVGLSGKLKEAGANDVYLFVTHAIMSKGVRLAGIKRVYATNSLWDSLYAPPEITIIPISMKELK
jgi:ribose-phosphate pyrophosphokinase